jgi:phosphoribosylformylglycinamidine synthase (EC 6.3.5.3)
MAVRRIFVEKKPGFDIEAKKLLRDLRDNLQIKGLRNVRILQRYDCEGIPDDDFERAKTIVFSEPPVDMVYDENLELNENEKLIAVEYLPGQYDQRADSAVQCIQIMTQGGRPTIRVAKIIVLDGDLTDEDLAAVRRYVINPVETREASPEKPETLEQDYPVPEDVALVEGFTAMTGEQLEKLLKDMGFAMSPEDLKFIQDYFRNTEKRDPTVTELRVLDTYWSDHCRHTTFLTEIESAYFDREPLPQKIRSVYGKYLKMRDELGRNDRPVCLMDIATLAMKYLKEKGCLDNLDESDEINACSIVVQADIDGRLEDWLVMFKNETHNHPTEIEPFGGAATCLGGAIRDPLSGRSYVYQAMRVTGSGDPRTPISETLPGKLPQRVITTTAAHGYSSYGNQVGLATGTVAEIYHEDYVAKRMEIGAVVGAAPKSSVVRMKPEPGDIVILLGGRTGRDGCGGATGSSKEHTMESLLTCGAEVQKGNPPTERKIQRLFRKPEVCRMIKKCNDFGAGGVSVAIGELADGLDINLDAVPKKYEGLDGTELAISESQERMAVVVSPEDADRFIKEAREENLEATKVAVVTGTKRLRMSWRGRTIVDISRDFINTNGVRRKSSVRVSAPEKQNSPFKQLPKEIENLRHEPAAAWLANLKRLDVCSQKGLVERFDSTIGAGTVLMPFGGKYQMTPADGMAAKLPVLSGDTTTGTLMTFGFNPYISKWSPFHGAVYAILESLARLTALGGDYRRARLTLQEYFEKLGSDPLRWGKPFSALLGAFYAQLAMNVPAIGGKDSMSGTFMDLNVPPTLVSFALAPVDVEKVVSQEFKKPGSRLVLVSVGRDDLELPDFEGARSAYAAIHAMVQDGQVLSASAVKAGGIAEAISKMSFGNRIGARLKDMPFDRLFRPDYGSILLELPDSADADKELSGLNFEVIGETIAESAVYFNGCRLSIDEMLAAWQEPLESVFPTRTNEQQGRARSVTYNGKTARRKTSEKLIIARPRVFIPVFPGTNCEYDLKRKFERANAVVDLFVMKNLTAREIEASILEMKKRIDACQIMMIPGGFSAGDEPDGSGKFIATVFRNPLLSEAVMNLIKNRDGLILGICNGFQALIKLGLLPYGEIRELDEDSPTLTFNTIGRHVSCLVRTRVASGLSPWLSKVRVGEIYTVAVSHGEGRFVASPAILREMELNGQIATQYVDPDGNPTMEMPYNPNGSVMAIEGITSKDGRIFGKMGHDERFTKNTLINVPGEKDQKIFEAGVEYFL